MAKVSLFLFDVDGVLVEPIAYRVGVCKTLEVLFERIGVCNVRELLPTEKEISRLESVGVHDLWDITNIVFTEVLCSIALSPAGSQISFADDQVESMFRAMAKVRPFVEKPSIEDLADALSLNPTVHPPDVVLSTMISRLSCSFKGSGHQQSKWFDLFASFLRGTRDPYLNYGTRLFQNIILGSDEFAVTYGLDSEYDGPSLLKLKDKALISHQSLSKLERVANAKSSDIRIAVYTARPSHPPKDAPDKTKGYSPEAELAVEMANMTAYPLVGMGMMEWLASHKKERTEDLTKPNTTQAIAGLLACAAGETTAASLEQAYAIDKLQMTPDLTPLGTLKRSQVTVFVFEDTISGIFPMVTFSERLREAGYSITVQPLGIARDPKKKAALEQHCSKVFPDVDAAIDFAINF